MTVLDVVNDRLTAILPGGSLRARLVSGAFWSLAGTVVARGLGLLSSIVLARMLGRSGFGELNMIQGTVGMFGTFAGLGLGLTATKYIAELRASDPIRAGRIMSLAGLVALGAGGVAAIVLLVLAPWLSVHVLACPRIAGLLRIGALGLFISALNAAQTGALAGFEAFRATAFVGCCSGIATLPLSVCGVYVAGLKGAVWATTISLGITWLLSHLALRRAAAKARVPFIFVGCQSELGVLWRFSLPAALGSIIVAPLQWASSAVLANRPGGYPELGVYNAALRIKQVPEMILAALLAPVLPILSEQFGAKNAIKYKRTLCTAYFLSCATLVPFAVLFASLPNLLLLPYGEAYHGYPGVVQFLMIHTALVGLFSPLGHVLASTGRMGAGLLYNTAWAIVLLLLSTALVPMYGAAGLAAAFSLTHLITSVACFVYLRWRVSGFLAGFPLLHVSFAVLILMAAAFAVSALPQRVAVLTGSALSLLFLGALFLILRPHRALFQGSTDATPIHCSTPDPVL